MFAGSRVCDKCVVLGVCGINYPSLYVQEEKNGRGIVLAAAREGLAANRLTGGGSCRLVFVVGEQHATH